MKIKRFVIYRWNRQKTAFVKQPISVVYKFEKGEQYFIKLIHCIPNCYLQLIGLGELVTTRDIKCYILGHQLACGFDELQDVEMR